jgi:nitrile hydratase
MQGAHDLGGKHGLGFIKPEPENEEPVFHTDWERKVFGLTMAAGMLGKWNIDESRYARECQHPIDYLSHSYYENWLAGLTKLLIEKDLISNEELKANSVSPSATLHGELKHTSPQDAEKILTSGGTSLLESAKEQAFSIGDSVRVRKNHTTGHTRAPSYVQGSTGTIFKCSGCHVFPDTHAKGIEGGEHLYTVCFIAESLWGTPTGNSEVLVDLWEPYLEAAE